MSPLPAPYSFPRIVKRPLAFCRGILALLLVCTGSAAGATVETFTGRTFRGLAHVADAIEISTETGPVKLAFEEVLHATFTESESKTEVPAGFVLHSGTRLAATPASFGGPTIELPERALRVPSAAVAWIVYSAFPSALAAKLPAGKSGALLPGGDFFEGTLKGADAAQCKLVNPIFGLRTFDARRGEIHALVLRDVKPTPANFELRTTDGSLFLADSITSERGAIALRGALFGTVRLRPEEIAELRAGPSRYLSLAERQPLRLDAPQRFRIGRTLEGEELTDESGTAVAGFESAVGAAGVWEIPPGFTTFSALVHIPAAVPSSHRLAFVVYADGRPVFRTSAMTSQDAPVAVRTTLGTARSLALRVEAVFPTHATGRGQWRNPTLLRR